MKIKFDKYSALGNNFIITHFTSSIGYNTVREMCNLKSGIGADGLIMIRKNPDEMMYFNRDGSTAKLCGNGLRCAIDYLKTDEIGSILVDGIFYDYVNEDEITVTLLKKNEVRFFFDSIEYSGMIFDFVLVDMIVPHVVLIDFQGNEEDLVREIRKKEKYKKANINFYLKGKINTYEHGVGLTSSCGTGSAAVGFVLDKDIHIENDYGKMDVLINDYVQLRSKVKLIFKGVYYV